jgi:hypothetical protein
MSLISTCHHQNDHNSQFTLFCWLLGRGQVKAKSFQIPDMFPKEFLIAPHFYPICFGKCCPPFTYIGGPKFRNSIFQNRTFSSGEPLYYEFLRDGPIKLTHCIKK